jgi:uncharacterized protein YjbJ (UPF0337 family)
MPIKLEDNIMKSSTKDQTQGAFHKMAGKIKEFFGKASMDTELEAEGKEENTAGKVQQKVGDVEKVLGR